MTDYLISNGIRITMMLVFAFYLIKRHERIYQTGHGKDANDSEPKA